VTSEEKKGEKQRKDHENIRQTMRTNIMGIHNHFYPAKAKDES
jgi:hypothetical protein